MNIAAIYDKYDLWGKVRVKFSNGLWHILINGQKSMRAFPSLSDAIKTYRKCEHCEGTGEVSAPHYTKGGEAPDCDFEKCKYCNGTGEKDAANT